MILYIDISESNINLSKISLINDMDRQLFHFIFWKNNNNKYIH